VDLWTRCDPAEVYACLAELLAGRPAWQRDALCLEHPEVDFLPARGEPSGPAKAVCVRCMVRDECLAVAMADSSLSGVWGGLSGGQRRALRRRRAAA
jgi:WhiB family redox-sensing transcriptional regulator